MPEPKESQPNWIALAGSVNARDVGGLQGQDGRPIASGVLLRSANLQRLTPEDVELLVRELGVRRVVDLRTGLELAAEGSHLLHDEPDVVVHHLSLYREQVTDRAETLPDVIRPWTADAEESDRHPTVASYLKYLHRRPDSIVAALDAIAEPGGATLVHCAAGKDRTGVVVALALFVAGVSVLDISRDYAATAQQLELIYALLETSPFYAADIAETRRFPAPQVEIMTAFFEGVDEDFSGVLPYLHDNGFSADQVVALRSRLLS